MHDVREIPVDQIVPDPDQPRKNFDLPKLVQLGKQIKAEGQLQDCEGHLDPENPDQFILTDGQRRWEACRNAGIPTLRMKIVEPKNAADKLMRQILYNSGEPMTIMENVNAFKRAIDELEMTVGEVSEAMGVSTTLIEKDLPLADLHEKIQTALDKGEVSKAVARKIVELPVNKHEDAFARALKGRTAKKQLANVEAYIAQVNQQKLWDDNGVPEDEAQVSGQKLIAFMKNFTKLHKDGHINGRLKSAVGARSRRIPDLKELAKAVARFSNDLEKACHEYEAAAEVNKAA